MGYGLIDLWRFSYERISYTATRGGLVISEDTKALIVPGVSENTLNVYRRAAQRLEAWLDGQILTDELLATYFTQVARY